MSLHMTPEMMELGYDLVRCTMPFVTWKLPDPDDLEFKVLATKERCGHFRACSTGAHEIAVSYRNIGSLGLLLPTLMHEVLHLKQHMDGGPTTHNAEFRRLAKLVAEHHCLDPNAI